MEQCPKADKPEYAFIGRSNVGKSSLINMICNNQKLAKTSSSPGKTQLINHFLIESIDEKTHKVTDWYLVDLPGYGYAKVPEQMRRDWQKLMESYLTARQNLCGLVIIMDVRQPLKDYDYQMLEWCQHFGTPSHILLTKADKLSRNQANQTLFKIQRILKEENLDASVQLFSALNKTGIESLQEKLDHWYGLDQAVQE